MLGTSQDMYTYLGKSWELLQLKLN